MFMFTWIKRAISKLFKKEEPVEERNWLTYEEQLELENKANLRKKRVKQRKQMRKNAAKRKAYYRHQSDGWVTPEGVKARRVKRMIVKK